MGDSIYSFFVQLDFSAAEKDEKDGVQSELGSAASRKATLWDLRLASLLTHLLLH